MVKLALLACIAACGARSPAPERARAGDDVTLYRDWAVIRQRVELDVPAEHATVTAYVAAGVTAEQLLLIDRGGLTIEAVHAETEPAAAPAAGEPSEAPADEPSDDEPADPDAEPEPEPPPAAPNIAAHAGNKPTELRLDVRAPHPGKYAIVIGYATKQLDWDVAYTMAATPRRDRGLLRGALAIRNTTGLVLHAARARLVDSELGAWRGKSAERLAASLVGGKEASTPPAMPRDLGALDIGAGETRVELFPAMSRPMRSVLVYDPIGTKLDNPGPTPLRDTRLGLAQPPSSRVTESFEVTRDPHASDGLPAGPVRLFERRADGSLVVLGESRLFESTARAAKVDTIAIGTADGVTGSRERRELTIDDDNQRVVEEFVITLDNQRTVPASVLVREHLYRGQNWTLAYHSATAAAKEGPQQIALRAEVGARSKLRILYVVVYTWGQ